jgi:hypothetical protein
MQGNVMIARHDNLRPGQAVEKSTRFLKLMRAGTLRQISGHGYQIGVDLLHRLNQRSYHMSVNAAKMDVGKMNYRTHYLPRNEHEV